MRKRRNEAKRLGIGEVRDGEAQKFAQERVLCENFAQALFTRLVRIFKASSNGENFWLLRVGNVG